MPCYFVFCQISLPLNHKEKKFIADYSKSGLQTTSVGIFFTFSQKKKFVSIKRCISKGKYLDTYREENRYVVFDCKMPTKVPDPKTVVLRGVCV